VLVEALDAADLAGLARTTLETNRLDSAELFDVASYKGGFVYDTPTGDYIHDWFRAQVVEILGQNSSERMAAADRRLRDHAVGATIGLLITAAITFLVSRSIIRPLRSLTAHVIGTATDGLPAAVRHIQETPLGEDVPWPALPPVGVSTADEVGDVAEAFTTMQQSALDLAVEEAMLRRHITDSLVTLGQRNQSLLARQLTFITDLERNETDPDTLADLYYLDHLAVRMRRNAELLLVLAGVDPPRKWVGPTPVVDIIRAALGEAAEYKRVRVHDVEHATIAGSATVELSHLLAELVENALVYSPPGDIVSISARHRPGPGGADDFYVITVQDSGVGMTPEDMEQANRRLSSAESHSVAPSKYMGHYIAGKLAARHGIVARLHPNPSGEGVLATVGVPAHLLTSEAHPDTVTQLPPLPPLPAHAPLPPLPPDDAADRPDEPAASSARTGREVDPAEVPTAEMVEINLPARPEPRLDDYDDVDDYDDHIDPSAPVPLKKQPQQRGRRNRPLPSNRLPIPPRTGELSIAEDSDTAS
jgi:signal transduction histidine kinase